MTGEADKTMEKAWVNSLGFVDLVVHGKTTQALVDTGATHNFMTTGLARAVGLTILPSNMEVKAVNSKAKVTGLAHEVPVQAGDWTGQLDFTVMEMNDFDIILGQDFLKGNKAIVVPFCDEVVLVGQTRTWTLPTHRQRREVNVQHVSAVSLERAMKESDMETYAVVCKGVDGDEKEMPIPAEISDVLAKYADLMPDELPKKLPPRRAVDHSIELELGKEPPAKAPYRLSGPELEELKRQLKELADVGFIRPSRSPYGAPVLFQRKKDSNELRMCCDYRALNKQTVRNRYPLPLAADCFDKLVKARVFSKLDLRHGYYQVRIAEGDEKKTAIVTRYGSFEFLVMSFGLCNAPATFCTLMNDVLRPYLDSFVVVYLDDIVVYSDNMEDHKKHLAMVFKALRENQLFLKKSKCVFAQTEISFLGHIVGQGYIRMEPSRVKAIEDWVEPKNVHDMRVFLGMTNYQRRFVEGYSKVTAALTDLLIKDKKWCWTEKCQKAFDELKRRMVIASDEHPVAYESRKLQDRERRYPVHEKEMTAIIQCLHIWRHYLVGKPFVVKTDNVATSYFASQPKLSAKQARWQDFLAEFDMTIEYRPGRHNAVADALSRKGQLAALEEEDQAARGRSRVQMSEEMQNKIKESIGTDALAQNIVKQVKEGKTRRFFLREGFLFFGNRLYVPKSSGLRRHLLKECHDSPWAGHPGQRRSLALLERGFFWEKMREDMEEYVHTCIICQQDKSDNQRQGGLLQPLPIPKRPWMSVSMDFITQLPQVQGYNGIMVVVDRFSKYVVFVPTKIPCGAERTAELFFKNIVKYWGIPLSIVSDRDPRFTGRFWTTLFKLVGTELLMSSSYHPQTDGQTERINTMLEDYLRHYVTADQKNWPELLDIAQFSYNIQKSSATGYSPFELVNGQMSVAPHTVVTGGFLRSPLAKRFMKAWEETLELARLRLHEAARRMKKYADRRRREAHFDVGDMVFLRITREQFEPAKGTTNKLTRKYEGPFRIKKKVGEAAYELELPRHMNMKHPVFHVSQLKRCRLDSDHPERVEPTRGPAGIVDKPGLELEKIVSLRTTGVGCHRRREFLCRWKDTPEEESWETEDLLWRWKDKIAKYDRKLRRRAGIVGTTMTSGGGECSGLQLCPRARPTSSRK
eukprot:PITA_26665